MSKFTYLSSQIAAFFVGVGREKKSSISSLAEQENFIHPLLLKIGSGSLTKNILCTSVGGGMIRSTS